MNFLVTFLKSQFKSIIVAQMKANEDKIITRLLNLLGSRLPVSGELQEHLLKTIYDVFEVVVAEQIELIGKKK
jgi:hypothetical protein